ncbi:MAG TPA: acetate/propionate family kinase [Polyangiaceae bacterium LLY-WYZ-15_(1-7)]|nr:acetate kinase [Myxococcales bacterium]MAT28803.1 acetate kinase [Sandaracinus sp.]HJL03000.1 acetate/propionate family kinase [Polyangiaceae bacterium LLY-WYZ-15_(1-7)]MBJ72720.1 acetate kinase [Sandaracinus sp.]HJL13612.1 acetate/propionate family kinase [Polyangiaceae bacterium LLY-WYZ-15_(1-7)]
MKVLVINCGSSSVKYQVVESDSGERLAAGVVERIGEEGRTHSAAVKEIVEATKEHGVEAVGHRVVHGGPKFHDATLVDDEVKAAIEACVPLAPLHNPANLAGLEAARAALPDVPHVAVFDTAFHARMPRRAATYAIDRELAEKHQLRRYGFHGTSHAFVARLAAEHLGGDLRDFRIITLHLGNGASACAVEYGSSVETSMGLTPLEGLVMGTRSGDVDPGLVLKLARELGVDETDRVLNRESGLKGLSGLSNDLRDLQAKAAEGHDGARLAINVFAHQARKYIGAYATVMGGVDAIVLTAGIGENSADMRRRILQRLEFLGVRLDEEKNFDAKVSDDDPVRDIGAANARVRTLVIATNEELEIARQTAAQVQGAKTIAVKKPIPIAVSARHVHLTRESLDVLFGEGYELTPYKPLSQPGQFAAEEKVNLIGPRARIDGVRILGPLRPGNQIEISRTDEFKLGVDAPVRHSGKVKNSAPITLEGPKGTLHLEEGLICAWRHIHMTPEDAAAYGVKDKEYVEVAIKGGPRDLIFGDVLVRVKDSYALEMHIDTDEANAAELGRISEGDIVYTDVYVEETQAEAVIQSKSPAE